MSKLTTRQRDKLIEAAQNAIEFTVESTEGVFPIDMLRYDLCWPATQEDAHRIHDGTTQPRTPRNIKLKGLKLPTFARWRSFGWTVLPMEGEFSR
jgi:hypothetical protein